MGKKTVKRLAILIGALALIGGGGYLLRAFQVERMAQGVVVRAQRAAAEGRYNEAAQLYQGHLAVVPDDVAVQIEYAELILRPELSNRRDEALTIFEDVLRRYPGRSDVRRRVAELSAEIGGGMFDRARHHLETLQKTSEWDGHLEYLMGLCDEHDNEFARADEFYAQAIEHGAPERLEAAQRRAILLRDKLGKKAEADQVIDAMVKAAPDDYRVYLGRGRYREGSGDKKAGDDFRKAMDLAPDRGEVYLEVARAVERESGPDAARRILEKGLKAAPRAAELYLLLAALERRSGRDGRAIEALELGVQALPDQLDLRWQLALLLARRGEAESGRLLLQIAELDRLGANRAFTRYLRAYNQSNRREFLEAKRILTSLQVDVARNPGLKSMVNLLLAQVHGELGEVDQQQEALLRAVSTNPDDLSARLGWVRALLDRGELDEAIREYRALYAQQPAIAREPLVAYLIELMIERVASLPEARRQWGECEQLIAGVEAAGPGALEPKLLRARLLLEQGQEAKAYDVAETVRAQFPKETRPWTAQATMLIRQRRYDEAMALLDRAREQFGDRIELRLTRLRLASTRGGPQAGPILDELGRGVESFSHNDRIRLLTALAVERSRRNDPEAAGVWEGLAAEEPRSLQPRLNLFDLAMRADDAELAERRVGEVAQIDGQFGELCRAQFLAWKARNAKDANARLRARSEARSILGDLKARRPDWARVPLALAELDREELAELEDGGDRDQAREKLESMIASYRRAIELGQRDPALVRRYIELLFRAGRGGEALEFYGRMPAGAQLTGDLSRVATQVARANRDYQQAEEIARKAVEASPGDFQARVWLSQVLIDRRNYDEAEDVIRRGLDADKADPERWITLVRFLVMIRQGAKAEQAVREAEAPLAGKPLALAGCCSLVGKSLELAEPDRAQLWYAQALGWFDKARAALKDPNDLSVDRRLAEFLLSTNKVADAEAPLKKIMARTADGKSPTLASWARRSLAVVYAATDPPRIAEALALFPAGAAAGADAEDFRVLSQIHQVQGTPEGRRQAIADLRSLIGLEAATPEDRRRLAQLLEADGDWPAALEQFRELVLRTDSARDPDTLSRRPAYLALLIEGLVRHHRPGDVDDLAEARRLVEKLEPTQRNPLVALQLRAEIDKAAGRPDEAARRLREAADRDGQTTLERLRLAEVAERLALFDVAEAIYGRTDGEPPPEGNNLPNRARHALFLARRGRVKDAVDLCDGLWDEPKTRLMAADVSLRIACDPAIPLDESQVRRVVGRYQKAIGEDPQSMRLTIGLGNILERIGDYDGAEAMYRKAIRINDRDGIASNNLAWLMALKGEKGTEALDLINKAIRVKGPLPEYLDTRGMIYLGAGERQRAVADLEAALRGAPTSSKYFHLAQAYLQLDDKEKARKALEAGKSRGLPVGLHNLELAAYKKVAGELGQ